MRYYEKKTPIKQIGKIAVRKRNQENRSQQNSSFIHLQFLKNKFVVIGVAAKFQSFFSPSNTVTHGLKKLNTR